MFNTNILDLIIGLIFIFTIYSLLASSVLELIAGIIGLRAKMLEAALINLFEAKKDLTKINFRRYLLIFWKLKRGINISKTFSDVFLIHPGYWL